MSTLSLTVVPTPFFGANCVVVVAAGSDVALVVDPSHGALGRVRAALDAAGARPGAVLVTHGHPDHVWDAAEVARWGGDGSGGQVPVWIPGPDRYRMDDPLAHVPMRPEGMTLRWERPSDLRDVPLDAWESVPGVRLRMVPAPGHTEGSAVFLGQDALNLSVGGRPAPGTTGEGPWALTGDVVFAGSVGRTDLPGGDEVQMRHTLRTLANAVDPATVLVPGHGPTTTMARELGTNPYLIRARRVG